MQNVVKVRVFADPQAPSPTLELPDVPWYAGITALQAMIIGEALHSADFSFRVVYRSIFGAFVDCIDQLADGDQPNHFWILYINGVESPVGAGEATISEDNTVTQATIEWRYEDTSEQSFIQAHLKQKPMQAY